VERVGTVEDPRIARITALCEDMFESADPEVWTYAHQLRAVLGEVQPAPPHGTDRDALIDVLAEAVPTDTAERWLADTADRILALVRPVEGDPLPLPGRGVWISVEDVGDVIWAVRCALGMPVYTPVNETHVRAGRARALAARLKASS